MKPKSQAADRLINSSYFSSDLALSFERKNGKKEVGETMYEQKKCLFCCLLLFTFGLVQGVLVVYFLNSMKLDGTKRKTHVRQDIF
jgi:hypothetical protein